MAKKVSFKLDSGKTLKGEVVEFEVKKEDWNVYKLKNGKTLRLKTVVAEVIELEGKDPVTGERLYIARSQNILKVV